MKYFTTWKGLNQNVTQIAPVAPNEPGRWEIISTVVNEHRVFWTWSSPDDAVTGPETFSPVDVVVPSVTEGKGTSSALEPLDDAGVVRLAEDVYEKSWAKHSCVEARRMAFRAVAEHVRRERCVVTRAMQLDVDLHVEESEDGSGRDIEVVWPDVGCVTQRRGVAGGDVVSTIDRMLDGGPRS